MRHFTWAAVAAITALTAGVGLAACSSSTSSSAGAGSGSTARAGAASCSNAAIQSELSARGFLPVPPEKPVYPPWFVNNTPTNGQGYESAVAYAIAAQLGFAK